METLIQANDPINFDVLKRIILDFPLTIKDDRVKSKLNLFI